MRRPAQAAPLPIVELVAEKWVPGGDVLARHEGKAVFVAGALPGEKVQVQLSQSKKDFAKGHVLEVLEASRERVEPQCKYFNKCGGCSWQHASYAEQLRAKEAILKDTLARQGGLRDFELEPIVPSAPYAYRGRVRVHADGHGGWGFLSKSSKALQTISMCPVLEDVLNDSLKKAKFPRGEHPVFTDGEKVIYGNEGEVLEVPVLHKKLPADHKVFFQSNRALLEELIQKEILPFSGHYAMDLFSGIGTFAAFLEDKFERVVAVERDIKCLALAQSHLQKTKFYTGAAEDWARDFPSQAIDFLVVDPPRLGLDPSLIPILKSWKPRHWLYISCDPVSLARDLKGIMDGGDYELVHVRPYDFYPQTPHLETAALLRRKA